MNPIPIDSIEISESTKSFIRNYVNGLDVFYMKYDVLYLVYEIVRLEYFGLSNIDDFIMFHGKLTLASRLSPTVSNLQILRDYFELDSIISETQKWIPQLKNLQQNKETLIGIMLNVIPALAESIKSTIVLI